MNHIVYLGLGTNLGERESLIRSAIRALKDHVGELLECSSLYETEPWGFHSENRFLNAAASFQTRLTPEEILAATQYIEQCLGRTQKSVGMEYTDRPIDIDILLISPNVVLHTDQLTIPHPQLHKRSFVLDPLAEIAPELIHPIIGKTVKELRASLHGSSE